MNKYAAIFANDMKNTRRDPTLLLLLFVPLLFILLTKFGLPTLTEYWPEATMFYTVLIAFFCVLTAVMPGFIVAFMLLDERDQNVLLAIRIMPVKPAGYFGMKMLFMFLFGLIGCFLLLQLNGVVELDVLKSLLVALVCASCSPFFVFFTISFAKNKIEGATMMKVLNTLLMLPIIALFIDHPFTYLMGLIPFFWIYKSFEVINDTALFFAFLGTGLIVGLIIDIIFYRIALKRYYQK